MESLPPVLITSLCATGVAVARALCSYGVKVYGTDIQFAVGRFSKYINRPDWGFQTEVNECLLETLIRFSQRLGQKPVLFPTNDTFIEFVGEHYEILKKHYIMQSSLTPSVSRLFLNKKSFSDLCEKHGINCPKSLYLSGSESAADVAEQIRFPVILKPHLIHRLKRALHGKKVIFVKNYDDLAEVFEKWRAYLRYMLVQEFIEGEESDIWIFKGYFDENGRLLDAFTGRKLRQYPPIFGSACLTESVPNDEVGRISVEFLKRVRFKGLCGTEFKYDSRDNDYKMIEINIRPQTWDDLMRLAGKEVLWTAYCDLIGHKQPLQTEQIDHVKWVYLTRDIASAFWHMKQGNLRFSDWYGSYKGVSTDAVLDRNDMKMLIGVPLYSLYQFYQYYFSKHE